MAKKSHHPIPPTIEELITYMTAQSGPILKKQLCKAFGTHGDNRANIKQLVREMREKGIIVTERRGKRIMLSDTLPERVIVEVTGIDSMGDLVARPFEWLSDTPMPQVIITEDTLNPPAGIGDIIQVETLPQGNRIYHGKTLRRVTAGDSHMVGVYEKGRVYSFDRRLKQSFVVTGVPAANTLEDGAIIMVDIPPIRVNNPQALFIKQIGYTDDPYSSTLASIYMHNLPTSFPESVLSEADKLKQPKSDKKRVDLRRIPFVTVDGADARDFDDAVWAEPDTSADNPGGYHIMIGIADVSWFVRPETHLDIEARLRGNSVYFPDRVIPMLPEALSNDLCSLKPGADRAALVCECWINGEGRKIKHQFYRATIRSERRLTYAEVQAAMDGQTPIGGLEAEMSALFGAYEALKKSRAKRGVLEIDSPERQIILNNKGQVLEIKQRERTPSTQMIEELMILANVSAAETLESLKAPVMYRVHAAPSPEKLAGLKISLMAVGQVANLPAKPKPVDFNPILMDKRNESLAKTVNELVLRSQSQAEYSSENIGHFGLALTQYAHFTSPIRRYADILVHRSLVRALELGEGGLTDSEVETFADTAKHISATERNGAMAELDAADRYIATYLENKIGQTFDARIVSVMSFGMFLAIEPFNAEGYVTMNSLPGDYYDYEEEMQRLVGRVTGSIFALGDTVRVTLKDCTPITGNLSLQVIKGDTRHDLVLHPTPKIVYKKTRQVL